METTANDDDFMELKNSIFRNVMNTLNCVPKYSKYWLPLLSCLAVDVDPHDLGRFVHRSASSLSESLGKSLLLEENLFFISPTAMAEKKKLSKNVYNETPKKDVAAQFLVEHTKETQHSHRLITKEPLSSIFAEYIGQIPDPLSIGTFTEVYKHERILRDKHCEHTIYACPICDDLLPQALALELVLKDKPEFREDHSMVKSMYFIIIFSNSQIC